MKFVLLLVKDNGIMVKDNGIIIKEECYRSRCVVCRLVMISINVVKEYDVGNSERDETVVEKEKIKEKNESLRIEECA